MDMNRIAPLQYDDAANRVGEVVIDKDGNRSVNWRGIGHGSTGLLVVKINQLSAEVEKLQHICYALSKVATIDPNVQDEGDDQAASTQAAS